MSGLSEHHPGTGARGIEVLGRYKWTMAGASVVPGRSAWQCFVPYTHQESCKIPLASQRGAVSGGTSWARSEPMATPYLQPVQPQPAAASHHATGPQGAGRDRVSREQRQEED